MRSLQNTSLSAEEPSSGATKIDILSEDCPKADGAPVLKNFKKIVVFMEWKQNNI